MTVTDKNQLVINVNGKTKIYEADELKEVLEKHEEQKELLNKWVQTMKDAPYQYFNNNLDAKSVYGVHIDELKQPSDPVKPTHYNKYKITPLEFILKNDIPFTEGNVIKYICRWKDKNGAEDLKKAKEYIEQLIKHQEK